LNNKYLPYISIVIPTYNHAKFIFKALQSVLHQTYENWEAIVIDNHSTDDTSKIIKKFNDPRIKFLKIVNNGVIAKSRNLGINNAKGEWIAFLDSDDWWTNDKLETCLNNIDDKVDLIYHDLQVVHDKYKFYFKKEKYRGRELSKPVLIDLLKGGIIHGNAIGNSSVIVRKNKLDEIGGISENKKLVGSEDYNTWLRIAQITDEFKYLKKKLGYNLIHDRGVSRKDMSIPQRQAIKDFMKYYNHHDKINLEVKMSFIAGSYNYSINNFKEAKQNFMYVLGNGFIHLKLRAFLNIIKIIFKSFGFKKI